MGDMVPTNQVIRLCRKAGIKQQQSSTVEYIKREMFPELMEAIISTAVLITDYSENKTVQLRHVEKAVQQRFKKNVL